MEHIVVLGSTGQLETRVLICKECGEEFVFTIAAQQYFADKGIKGDPKRCKVCHLTRKRGPRKVAH